MTNQSDLFGYIVAEEPLDEGIVCIKCEVRQPITQFSVMQAGEIKRTCKSCRSGHRAILSKLRKENAYPDKDYKCPICKKNIEELGKYGQIRLQTWVLDHCHDTNTFRGWVCHKCNTGLGGFSDDLTITQNAVTYLVRHKEKIDEDCT